METKEKDVNTILDSLIIPKSKHYVIKYPEKRKDQVTIEFDYKEPSIREIIAISKQTTDLALSYNIPQEVINTTNNQYKNELNIINIVSHLIFTIKNLSINGKKHNPEFLFQIKDINLLFILFQQISQ